MWQLRYMVVRCSLFVDSCSLFVDGVVLMVDGMPRSEVGSRRSEVGGFLKTYFRLWTSADGRRGCLLLLDTNFTRFDS